MKKTKIDLFINFFCLVSLFSVSIISCRDDNSDSSFEEDLMPEKINYGWTMCLLHNTNIQKLV